jgi:hypothetical protein
MLIHISTRSGDTYLQEGRQRHLRRLPSKERLQSNQFGYNNTT